MCERPYCHSLISFSFTHCTHNEKVLLQALVEQYHQSADMPARQEKILFLLTKFVKIDQEAATESEALRDLSDYVCSHRVRRVGFVSIHLYTTPSLACPTS